jgi:flagellar protein FlbD
MARGRELFLSSADECSVEGNAMIELTRLNGTRLVLNSDLIQYAESSPDTTLTLINGEKLVVLESLEQVVELAILYRSRLIGEAARACPGGLVVTSGSSWRATAAQEASPREADLAAYHYSAR